MSLVMATTPGLVLCAPLAECAAWGRCARSRPVDVTARQQPAFKHFGPRPDGQRCGAFIDSWTAAQKHESAPAPAPVLVPVLGQEEEETGEVN